MGRRIVSSIVVFLSALFYVPHLIILDFQNVSLNIIDLDLSNIDDFFMYFGQIMMISILLIILVLSVIFIFLEKTYSGILKKLLYYFSLISIISFSALSIISSYDIASIFFEANPIDIINHIPSDTPTYLFRSFMIFLFVISIILLNIGLLFLFHNFIKSFNTFNSEFGLILLLFIIGILINLLPATIFFNWPMLD